VGSHYRLDAWLRDSPNNEESPVKHRIQIAGAAAVHHQSFVVAAENVPETVETTCAPQHTRGAFEPARNSSQAQTAGGLEKTLANLWIR
jgi:hypothetical protein